MAVLIDQDEVVQIEVAVVVVTNLETTISINEDGRIATVHLGQLTVYLSKS